MSYESATAVENWDAGMDLVGFQWSPVRPSNGLLVLADVGAPVLGIVTDGAAAGQPCRVVTAGIVPARVAMSASGPMGVNTPLETGGVAGTLQARTVNPVVAISLEAIPQGTGQVVISVRLLPQGAIP